MQDKVKKRKGYRWLIVLAVVLFLTGLAVLLFPVFTNWLYAEGVQQQKQAFEEQIKEAAQNIPETGDTVLPFEELYQELKRRNQELYEEKQKDLKDPFSYEQPTIDLAEYGLEGKIIGGDLSSAALDGFLCGFAGQPGLAGETDPQAASQAPASSPPQASGAEGASAAASAAPAESAAQEANAIPEDAWPVD